VLSLITDSAERAYDVVCALELAEGDQSVCSFVLDQLVSIDVISEVGYRLNGKVADFTIGWPFESAGDQKIVKRKFTNLQLDDGTVGEVCNRSDGVHAEWAVEPAGRHQRRFGFFPDRLPDGWMSDEVGDRCDGILAALAVL